MGDMSGRRIRKRKRSRRPESRPTKKPEVEAVKTTRRYGLVDLLDIIVGIVTIIGLILNMVAIRQADRSYRQAADQFARSGPVFALHPITIANEGVGLGDMTIGGFRKTGSWAVVPMVLVNTGRTEGTVIGVTRDEAGHDRVCLPDMTDDGYETPDGDRFLLGNRQITIQPGGSRLILFAYPTQADDGATRLTMDAPLGRYRVVTADGVEHAVRVGRADMMSDRAAGLYRGRTGYDAAIVACATY